MLRDGEAWRLVLGEAVAEMAALPDGCVDCVLTDPPFGVREDEWDDMSEQEFARFSMAWLSQARRVGKELIAFCSAYGPFRPLCEMLWPRVRVMVWDKPIGSQYAGSSERGLWFAHETILHCYAPERREYVSPKTAEVGALIRSARESAGMSRGAVDIAVRGRKTGLCYRWEEGSCLPTPEQVTRLVEVLGLNGDFHTALGRASVDRDRTVKAAREGASEVAARSRDVFSYRTETDALHPCQKPLGMMVELIERLTEPGSLILDPFAGSGTTVEAALRTERRAVGIERDPAYHATAVKRLAEAANSAPLFDAAPTQGRLFGPP